MFEIFKQQLDDVGQTPKGVIACDLLTDYAKEIVFSSVYMEDYPEWLSYKEKHNLITSSIQGDK